MAKGLQTNRSLTELTVRSCALSAEDTTALAAALQQCGARSGLRSLDLGNNPVDAAGAAALAAAMRNGLALERLGLDGCSLGDDEITALAAGFRHCPTLRSLSLWSNDFSAAGEAALATGGRRPLWPQL